MTLLTIQETRRENLKKLCARTSVASFARAVDKPKALLYNVISGRKSIGEKLARDIETAAGLNPGELDQPPTGATSNVIPAEIGLRSIPLLSFAEAGHDVDLCKAREHLMTNLVLSSKAYALEITGADMAPEFQPGDQIVIDPEIKALPGDYVVARINDSETTFKKYRINGYTQSGEPLVELAPLNPDYAAITSATFSVDVLGVMVEHRRYRHR